MSTIFYTHNGRFHCDEVAAFAILNELQKVHALVRVGKEDFDSIFEMAAPGDFVVDIGRKYDPEFRFFDHHQGGLVRPNGYTYASVGLIWKHYGLELIEQECFFGEANKYIKETNGFYDYNAVWKYVDTNLIQGLDANDSDNVYEVYAKGAGGPVHAVTLPEIIRLRNSSDVMDEDKQRHMFLRCSDDVGEIILNYIRKGVKVQVNRERFRKDIQLSCSGALGFLRKSLAWEEVVHSGEIPWTSDLRYMVMPSTHPGSTWTMVAVSKGLNTREVHLPIERSPEFTGFIHDGKWIAGSDSKIKLFKLAEYNLKLER